MGGVRTVHRSDHARLTVLSPHLVRVEWSPTGTFVDEPPPVVVNRDLASGEVPAEVTS